jgi:hypothetical protein
MKILIGCEESQAVTIAFRNKGHEAYSCDIQECTGGHPEWHFKQNIFDVIGAGKWDMLIAFPPCTYLSFAGNAYFDINKYGYKAIERWHNRINAMKFFMDLYNTNIKHIAIENPMGFPFTAFRKPDQTIEPYFFGDSDKKRTCLWLQNLPKLLHNYNDTLFDTKTHVDKPDPIYIGKKGQKYYITDSLSGNSKESKIQRSKTFPGIAKAMAEQWG